MVSSEGDRMGSELRWFVWVGAMPHLCVLEGGKGMCQWGGGHLCPALPLCTPLQNQHFAFLQRDCLCHWSFLHRHSVMDKHAQHLGPHLVGEGSQGSRSQASCISGISGMLNHCGPCSNHKHLSGILVCDVAYEW